MTRQENILTLNEHLEHWKRLLSEKICDQDEGEKTIDALQNAIKALEQEPCDDAISRQAAIGAIDALYLDGDSCVSFRANAEGDTLIGKYQAITALDDLPSVTPQPKMGRWIMSDDGLYRPICNNCGAHPWKGYIPTVEEATEVFKYCPNCGYAMQEVEG